jgi:hypothetical protein
LHQVNRHEYPHSIADFFSVAASCATLWAQPIAIENAGFESQILSDVVYQEGVAGWTSGGAIGSGGFGIGTWNPDASEFVGYGGDQIAYLNGGQMAQQLTIGLTLGAQYQLSALLGATRAVPSGGVLELWAGGTVADGNVIAGTLVGSMVVPTSSLVGQQFLPFSTTIDSPLSGPTGALLAVRFVSNGRESEIDDIQLSMRPVPEPSAFLVTIAMASLMAVNGLRLRSQICVV